MLKQLACRDCPSLFRQRFMTSASNRGRALETCEALQKAFTSKEDAVLTRIVRLVLLSGPISNLASSGLGSWALMTLIMTLMILLHVCTFKGPRDWWMAPRLPVGDPGRERVDCDSSHISELEQLKSQVVVRDWSKTVLGI